MRKRDELADPASCLGRATEEEWIFVLLERDAAAPAAVRAWIEARVALGKNARTDEQVLVAEEWIRAVVVPRHGHLLLHMTGMDRSSEPTRAHFCASEKSPEWAGMMGLVAAGLATPPTPPSDIFGGSRFFYATAAGTALAKSLAAKGGV